MPFQAFLHAHSTQKRNPKLKQRHEKVHKPTARERRKEARR